MIRYFIRGLRKSLLIQKGPPVFLTYATFYWISSILVLCTAIFEGGARVICKYFDPDPGRWWHIVAKYKVSSEMAICRYMEMGWKYVLGIGGSTAPFQAQSIAFAKKPENIDATSLKGLFCGGSRMPTEACQKLRKLLPDTFVSQSYGMTEAGGALLCFDLTRDEDRCLLEQKPDASGRPWPGYAYKIVDPDTELSCRINEKGELRIKSEFLSNGYYKTDGSLTFDDDGFFKTGDVVYFDEDFCFFIVVRIKDMLRYRNWPVFPTYLEQVLTTHPAVKHAAVVGIPHEIDCHHPMALVIPQERHGITEKLLEDYVRERVDGAHYLRGGVKFVQSFPLTASGKVKKAELRQLVLEAVI